MSDVLEFRDICASYRGEEVLHGVSFVIPEGKVLGLVGESGSGKSTIARVAAGLLVPDSGEILLGGQKVGSRRSREERKAVQMVFQNPEGSLNPKHRIGTILSDAMLYHGIADRAGVKAECDAWVKRMRLPEDTLSRRAETFSGGQKQRIALARALCVGPSLLIADEPTSALDVTVQLEMLDLIRAMKDELGLTILFISHDLGVIRSICDEVAVLKEGKVVEQGGCAEFFRCPATQYGRDLLDAVPKIPSDLAERVQ